VNLITLIQLKGWKKNNIKIILKLITIETIKRMALVLRALKTHQAIKQKQLAEL
jgi:predicted type IV restriction endonuclease